MKVMELKGGWGLEHVVEGVRPDPVAGAGEVLIRMAASSVNYRDAVVVRRGYGRLSGELPLIILQDGAGRVVACGPGVARVAVGDLVCPVGAPGWISGPLKPEHRESLLGGPRDGVMRELMAVKAEDVVKAPSFYSAVEAATLPCAALTAWAAITRCGVKAGDVVVTQGTGGVSLFALQFARALGAGVILTSGSPEKHERARALGADAVIDYRATPDWHREVRRLTGGRGADLVIELGGAGTLESSLRAVRVGGTVALIGVLSGARAPLDLGRVVTQSVRLQGVTLGSRDDFEDMVRAIERHRIAPTIDARRYGFTAAGAAVAALTEGRHFGKICVAF